MRFICFGAHPDDCEISFGGTAVKLARQGHAVKFVSVTNGNAGHHQLDQATLVDVRRREAQEAGRLLGIAESELLSNPDGGLTLEVEVRNEIIRRIRAWQADVVLTHRPWDYHPDHRYTSQLVQDSAYMVMVPHVCPDTPALRHNPVFLYLQDSFRLPTPFSPDVAVRIDEVWEQKVSALDAHASQFYEWLPFVEGHSADVPVDADARRRWLGETRRRKISAAGKEALVRRYGADAAGAITHAEFFQVCEYGRQPSATELEQIFPR